MIRKGTKNVMKEAAKEVQFEYKCRNCGKIYGNIECSLALAWQIMAKITTNQNGESNGVSLFNLHRCGSSTGLADLIGYRMIGK